MFFRGKAAAQNWGWSRRRACGALDHGPHGDMGHTVHSQGQRGLHLQNLRGAGIRLGASAISAILFLSK